MSFGEKANADAQSGASVGRNSAMSEKAEAHGFYKVECRDANGNLKWTDVIENLVTTAGKNFALDTVLAGASYTAAWCMGLVSSTSYTAINAADTMASHSGWLEAGAANAPTYSQSTRPTPAWSAASGGNKTTSVGVVFSITGSGTAKGCFLTTVSTKDGTTGTLYSVGLFTGGDKVLANADTLSVTYTASL